tara:strand:+ start:1350 stop:1586 length:237 start_codon:yes stop_codon:yes gene_type:complete
VCYITNNNQAIKINLCKEQYICKDTATGLLQTLLQAMLQAMLQSYRHCYRATDTATELQELLQAMPRTLAGVDTRVKA